MWHSKEERLAVPEASHFDMYINKTDCILY